MVTDSRGLKQYSRDKRNVTVHNVERTRKFLAILETHRELYRIAWRTGQGSGTTGAYEKRE